MTYRREHHYDIDPYDRVPFTQDDRERAAADELADAVHCSCGEYIPSGVCSTCDVRRVWSPTRGYVWVEAD